MGRSRRKTVIVRKTVRVPQGIVDKYGEEKGGIIWLKPVFEPYRDEPFPSGPFHWSATAGVANRRGRSSAMVSDVSHRRSAYSGQRVFDAVAQVVVDERLTPEYEVRVVRDQLNRWTRLQYFPLSDFPHIHGRRDRDEENTRRKDDKDRRRKKGTNWKAEVVKRSLGRFRFTDFEARGLRFSHEQFPETAEALENFAFTRGYMTI